MPSSSEEYVIGLVDRVSGPAEAAARQTAALERALTTVKRKMQELDEQSVFAKMDGNSSKLAGITIDLGKLEAAASRIKAQIPAAVAPIGPALDPPIEKTKALKMEMAALEGVVGGVAAVVGALLVGAAGLGALGVVGAKIALDASDFKGDTIDALSLVLETSEAASTTYDRLQDIANVTTMTNEEVQTKAFDLLAAGIHDGEQLDSTIRAIADLTAVKGAQAAGKLDAIIERATTSGGFKLAAKQLTGVGVTMAEVTAQIAERTGEGTAEIAARLKKGTIDVDIGIDALNAAIEKKLGGFAAKQLNDLDVQFKRFKDNSTRLFADIQTDKFLEGLASITNLLDQSTVSGQALKLLVTDIFQPMFDGASRVFPYLKIAFLEIIIVALELYIAMRPVREEWNRWLGTKGDTDAFEKTIMGIGEAFRIADAFLMPFVLNALRMVEAMAKLAEFGLSPFKALGAGAEATTAEKSRGGGQTIGEALAEGIADGMLAREPRVHAAADSLATGAKDRVAKTLDIHSPSRVMFDLGGDTADGFELGLRDGAGDAHDAMTGLTAPPGKARPGASSSGGGTVINVGGIVVHVPESAASSGGKAIGEDIAMQIAAYFETLQLQAGA